MRFDPSSRGSRALIVAAVSVLLAAATIGSFRADDWTNLERGQLALSTRWREVWSALNPFGFYRPLVDTWHGVMLRLWGLHPLGHLVPLIALLALQSLLLGRIVRLRGGSSATAWLAAAAVWAQVNTYAWTALWPSNVTGSLMTTFALLALTLHHRAVAHARAGRSRAVSVALAPVAMMLALLSKEEAVLLPLALAWLEAMRWRRLDPAERRTALGSGFAISVAVLLYAAFRLELIPPSYSAGERYVLHFGINWLRNLAFLSAHLAALPVVVLLLSRLVLPAAWRRDSREGEDWANARGEILAGSGWAAISIQLYLPIASHAYGYLYTPSFAVAFAVATFVAWAAGIEARATGRPAPAWRLIGAHWGIALVASAIGLSGIGWPRYGAITRDAFAELDRALPRPRSGATIIFLDPLERESIAGRSLFNLVFDMAPGSVVRLHYRREDLRGSLISGPAAVAATEHPPAADAVFLARAGRLTRIMPRQRAGGAPRAPPAP